jgi:hypothetical protein
MLSTHDTQLLLGCEFCDSRDHHPLPECLAHSQSLVTAEDHMLGCCDTCSTWPSPGSIENPGCWVWRKELHTSDQLAWVTYFSIFLAKPSFPRLSGRLLHSQWMAKFKLYTCVVSSDISHMERTYSFHIEYENPKRSWVPIWIPQG